MILPKFTLLLGLILTLLLDPISGKRGFGGSHSYPKSGGLSGGGHRSGGLSGGGHGYPSSGGSHGYPSSGGSHGYPSSGGSHSYPSSGGSHGYPSSGGLSGSNHGYPSSGGNHGYPSSGGSHGYPSSGGSHSYPSAVKPPSGGSHTYPSSGNSHGYPQSPGLSGGGRGYPTNNYNKPATHHTTHVTNHYHYSPPSQISYTPVRGAPPVHYPVYHGTPPTYVYQYKDSGSKYGTLLAGLALMNLGTLGVAGYAAYKANQNHGGSSSPYTYTPQKGEVCKFAIKKENGDYEETRIDCQIISGFILQDMEAQKTGGVNQSTITTTTTVTNVTVVNNTNVGVETTMAPPNILYSMLPNGTLVPVNVTGMNVPIPGVGTPNVTAPGAPNSSSVTVTTTTTNTTLVNALDVKGQPVAVTPGMQCFVIRNSPTSNMRKSVPCGLLQTYADQSISRRSSATRNVPMFTVVVAVLAYCFA